jgi:NAD(P)-dependent dehydrogenase (short-subunit alcohol dehydrogenase family)
MNATLENKTVLITGGSGGIGRACVEAFLDAGARIAMTDLGAAPEWARSLNPASSAFLPADLRDAASIERLVAAAVERFGGLDVLVNNAAVFNPQLPVHLTSLDEFEQLVTVNFRAVFLTCKHAVPHLFKSRGCIVNVSSMTGVTAAASHAVYSATKGAVNALTKAMAVDYGPRGVRCNAVCPSSVLTANTSALFENSPDKERITEFRRTITNLGYTAQPAEIASVVVFLASPAASFVTGAIMPVSGGSECGYGVKPPVD